MKEKQYAVFRIVKLKGLDDIGRVCKHDSRDKEHLPDNVDPKRSKDNILVKGSGDSIEEFKKRTEGIKIRSNAVLGYDAVCTFSNKVTLNEKELKKWSSTSFKWLENTFGKDNVLNVWMHLDEDTPHLHAFIVPVVEQDKTKKLNAREFTGGAVKMQQLQTSYYNSVKGFGLERGIEGSKAKHMSAKEFHKRQEAIKGRIEKMDSKTMQNEYINALIRIEQLEAERQSSVSKIGSLEDRLKSSRKDYNELYKAQQGANKKIAYFEQKIALMKSMDPTIEKQATGMIDVYQKRLLAKYNALPESKKANAPFNITDFKSLKEMKCYLSDVLNPLPPHAISHEQGYDILTSAVRGEVYQTAKQLPYFNKSLEADNYSLSGTIVGVLAGCMSEAQKNSQSLSRSQYEKELRFRLEQQGYTTEEIDAILEDGSKTKKKKVNQMEMG